MAAPPGQQRAISDKVHDVQEAEKQTQELMEAIGIALGLAAVVLTAGAALAPEAIGLMAAGTAAQAGSAVLSVYAAFEALETYEVQSAAANTDYDKAKSIAADEPDWLWLAQALITAGLDVLGAGAMFAELKDAIVAARARSEFESLEQLVQAKVPQAAPAIMEGAKAATTTGLASAEAMTKFAAGMKAIESTWSTLSETERFARIEEELALRFAEFKIPKVKVVPTGGGSGGHFAFATWSVNIGREAVTNAKTPEEIAQLVNTAYHEGRHAEQWFSMARMRAGMGDDAATIGKKMGITDQDVLDEAVKQKMPKTAPEFAATMSWWESVYGSGAAARNEVLTKLKPATDALNKAREDYMTLRVDKSVTLAEKEAKYADWEKAHKAWSDLYERYRALPEEVDAFAVGDAAEEAFLPKDPTPPPPPDPAPTPTTTTPPPATTPSPAPTPTVP